MKESAPELEVIVERVLAMLGSVVLWGKRWASFIHMRIWLHGVVSRKLHSILAFDLTIRKLHSVSIVAPFRQATRVVLEKIENVSIFYLHLLHKKIKSICTWHQKRKYYKQVFQLPISLMAYAL